MKTAFTSLKCFCFFYSVALIVPPSLFTFQAHADIKAFENRFSKIRPQLEDEFDLAESLQVPALPPVDRLGTPLTLRACQRVFQNATRWYPRDPFSLQFSGGTARVPTCGGPSGRAQNYVDYSFGNIGIDQQYVKIISYHDTSFVFQTVRRFYFDLNDKLVAITNYEFISPQTGFQSTLFQTEDRSGNQYHHEWQSSAIDSITGMRGTFSSVRVIPRRSLRIVTQSIRNRWTDFKNPRINRETRMLSQSLLTDWEDYFAPLPQNWFSAFFRYGGRWFSSPNNWAQIFKTQSGADLCYIGTVFSNRKAIENYPEDEKSFDDCMKR